MENKEQRSYQLKFKMSCFWFVYYIRLHLNVYLSLLTKQILYLNALKTLVFKTTINSH